MVFYPPSWVPKLPIPIPDTLSLPEFILDEKYGSVTAASSLDPFICGLSGKSYSSVEMRQRIDYLARALADELGWSVNAGTEFDKVAGIFSLNSVGFKSAISDASG